MNDCSWPVCGCDPEGIESAPCRAEHANEQGERLALAGHQPFESDAGPVAHGWVLSVGSGHSGMGVYAYMEEYPEEGSFLLLALGDVQTDAYAEGRKDQLEEQPMPPRALELLDEALAFAQEVWNGDMEKDDREGSAFNLRCALREYLQEVGYLMKDKK